MAENFPNVENSKLNGQKDNKPESEEIYGKPH